MFLVCIFLLHIKFHLQLRLSIHLQVHMMKRQSFISFIMWTCKYMANIHYTFHFTMQKKTPQKSKSFKAFHYEIVGTLNLMCNLIKWHLVRRWLPGQLIPRECLSIMVVFVRTNHYAWKIGQFIRQSSHSKV